MSESDHVQYAEAAGPRRGRVLRNTAYKAVGDVVSKVGSLVLFVVMARELGAADFGVFTFALSLAALVTILGGFGQDAILTREVARRLESVHDYVANTFSLKAALALPALALALVVVSLTHQGGTTRLVLLLLGIAVVAELLTKTCFAVFQAYERLEFSPVVMIAQRGFTAAVGVAALIAGAGVVAVAAIYLAGTLLAFFMSLLLLFRYVVRPRLVVRTATWSGLMRAALPVGLFSVFATTLFRADTIMLAFFEPDDVVGEYGAAYRLFESTLFLSWSVGAAVYPVFSRLRPDGEPTLGGMFESGVKLALALVLPLSVAAAVLAHPIVLTLYGSEFEDASLALALLAPAIALYPISYIAGYLLVSQDRQRVLPIVYAVVATQNILTNLVLIPAFSLYGAAASTSLSQLLLTVPLVLLARKTTGPIRWLRMLAGPSLASAVAAGVMVALPGRFGVALAASAIAYLVTLLVWEQRMFPADVRALRSVLTRRRRRRPAA